MKDFEMGKYVTLVHHEIVFDDGHNNGYGFPCDENGNLTEDNEAVRRNYAWCLAHPDEFKRYNKHITFETSYCENSTGRCDCGKLIELYDQYYGACQCPHCGQWWNLFGQALNDPSKWEEPLEEDY